MTVVPLPTPAAAESFYLRKTKLIEAAAKDGRLTPFEFRTLVLIYSYANSETRRMWPSSQSLAKMIGGTAPAVRHALGHAADIGYLTTVSTGSRLGTHRTTVYEIPPVIPEIQVNPAPVSVGIQVVASEPATCNPGTSRPVILGIHKPNEREPRQGEEPSEEAIKGTDIETETEAPRIAQIGSPGNRANLTNLPAGRLPEKPNRANPLKRPKTAYLASHGCTIDNYQPGPEIAAWAARDVPSIRDPIASRMVDEIKDAWRQRGEKPKDFDATYKNYLRKRQQWAEERAARNASGKPHESKPRAIMAGSAEAQRAYEVDE